jgi:hypothetical protein
MLNLVMLCSSVLHWYQSLCGWTFVLLIVIMRLSVIVFFLEIREEFLGCLFGSSYLFHFFPYVFNLEIQIVFSSLRNILNMK